MIKHVYFGGVHPLKIYISLSREHAPWGIDFMQHDCWVKRGVTFIVPLMSPLLLIHFRGLTLGTATICNPPCRFSGVPVSPQGSPVLAVSVTSKSTIVLEDYINLKMSQETMLRNPFSFKLGKRNRQGNATWSTMKCIDMGGRLICPSGYI